MRFLRPNRYVRLISYYGGAVAAICVLAFLAPGLVRGMARALGWSAAGLMHVAVVLFAALPAVGLGWFAWHMLFYRRARLQKLRRIRFRQGRSDSLLSPPPIFGGACESKDEKASDRDWAN